jgi:hypothetical protein
MAAYAVGFDQLWTLSHDQIAPAAGKRLIVPRDYQLAKLDVQAFKLFQTLIPTGEHDLSQSIWLPTPDGSSMEFTLFERSMMEEPLAKKYEMIKTYTGISVVNPHITAKMDFTLFGFHAVVFNGSETYYIDPYADMSKDWYVVYYKHNYSKHVQHAMTCEVDDMIESLSHTTPIHLDTQPLPGLSSYKTNGDTIRTYRLALACTEEYAAAVGGSVPTKASVLSKMVTTMNRVNGVFEREFAMKANLIGNNDTLIFLPGSGDPYTNASGSTMLGENQTTLTARIGSANYDFGHVFSTGGGGIASLGSVCSNTNKARGVTGSANPVGDPFDIDYVAHEMGHQFGGSHTFNSVTGSCSGNRSGTSAYEIGSATTIMGYAGICGSDNIQNNSDDYYHVRSLEQMTGNSVKACATKTVSGNTPPVLSSIAKSYVIPYKTSFELTASATDANGDPLTYCWEEYDRGGSGAAWNAGTTVAPIIRSFSASSSPTRVFPQYKELIKNTVSYLGERLPDTTRIVRFRCTVRDMKSGYGSFYSSIDTTRLDVRSTLANGLFRVSSQNTVGQTWQGFSAQTITWNVAGTNTSPISTPTVDIYISIDSGKTWPYLVASATNNDGSEVIYAPNENTKWARVKVKGSNNVFFDLNDEWIEIKKTIAPAGLDEMNAQDIQLFPNPATDFCQLQLPSTTGTVTIEVRDALGKRMLTAETSNSMYLIQCQGLSSGLYFVHIRYDNATTIVKKLIIEK